MKAFVIVVKDNPISEEGFNHLLESSHRVGNKFNIERFDAVTPDKVKNGILKKHNLIWNYPWEKQVFDESTGLLKTPYKTKDKNLKIACAMSHYVLWKKCIELNEPILILEHDSIWDKKLDVDLFMGVSKEKEIIGINSPLRATRNASIFFKNVTKNQLEIQSVPIVDEDNRIPQGLAGGSAYIIKSKGMQKVLNAVNLYGLWHNDAFLCRQLFDDVLGVSKTFYTHVDARLHSTTV